MSTLILPEQSSSRSQRLPRLRRQRVLELSALGLILLLCAALRVYHLGSASLWSDEIFSRYYVDVFGLHYVFHQGLSLETNPPTYYLLLRGWIALWGDSEAALRSLSALASTLCIPAIYLLGRELLGRSRGLVAALLFALCPTSLYFAQETRAYALMMLAGAGLLWAAAVFQCNSRSGKAATFYCVCGAICLYLHATGLLFVAACGGAVWLFLLRRGPGGRAALVKWTALNAGVMLLGLPYYLHALTASHSGIIDYVPPAGLHQLVYSASLLVSGIVTPYPWPGLLLGMAFFAILTLSLCLHRPSSRASVIMVGVPILFVGLVFLVSVRRPILLPRILVWAIVPLCLLAARQVMVAGRARFAVLVGLVVVFGGGLFFQLNAPNNDKEPLREIAQAFGPQLEQADLVVLSPASNPEVLRYYAPRVKNVRLWDASLHPTIMAAAAQRLQIETISETEILQAIRAGHSVWVVSHSFDFGRVDALRSLVPATVYRKWSCGQVPCAAVVGWEQQP